MSTYDDMMVEDPEGMRQAEQDLDQEITQTWQTECHKYHNRLLTG